MNVKSIPVAAVLACALAGAAMSPARAADSDLECKLSYSLSGWSLIYKHTTGTGVVTCNDGKTMPVRVTAKAVGLTAGKWHIDNGQGKFSDVHKIHDVLGAYAQASANAGLAKSGEAQVLTKGPVSLALSGAGEGINLGVDIGQFKIEPAR